MSVGSSLHIAILNESGDPEDIDFIFDRYPNFTVVDNILLSADSFVSEWEEETLDTETGDYEPTSYDLYYGSNFIQGLQRVIWFWDALSIHSDYQDIFFEDMLPEIECFAKKLATFFDYDEVPTMQTVSNTPAFDDMLQDMAKQASVSMRLSPQKRETIMKSHTIPDPERELLLDSESSDQMLTLHKQDFYAKLREYFFTIIHSDMVFKESVWMISAGDVLTSEPREAERELLVASQIGEVVETYRNDPTRMLEEIYLCGKDTSIMGSVWDIPEEDRKIPSDELVGFCDDLY